MMKGHVKRFFLFFLIAQMIILVQPLSAMAQSLESELKKAAEQLAGDLIRRQVRRVAVTDFVDLQGRNTLLGRHVADGLVTELFMVTNRGTESFEIIERTRLTAILRELQLIATDLVKPENAQKVGLVAGVDALIIGNMSDLGENISVTLRAISAETGRLLSAQRFQFMANTTLKKMLRTKLHNGQVSGGNVTSCETLFDDEEEGSGLKTAYFITKPVAASYDSGILTASMQLKNFTDKELFIGFLGDYNGNIIRSNIIIDTGVDCVATNASPLPFYNDVYFVHNNSHKESVREYLSYINPKASTILSVRFKCKGGHDIGSVIKSFDIGLHVAERVCPSKKKSGCSFEISKTSVAVRNVPIRKRPTEQQD